MNNNTWIKPLLPQYFVGTSNQLVPNDEAKEGEGGLFHSNIATAPTISQIATYGDPTFTPNANRATYKQNVSILMKAREVSMESTPLLWSNKQKKQITKKSILDQKTQANQEEENVYHNDDLSLLQDQLVSDDDHQGWVGR